MSRLWPVLVIAAIAVHHMSRAEAPRRRPSITPFSYMPKMSERLYNDLHSIGDPDALHDLRSVMRSFLKEHPYMADTFTPLDLLDDTPQVSFLDRLRGNTGGQGGHTSKELALKVLADAFQFACSVSGRLKLVANSYRKR